MTIRNSGSRRKHTPDASTRKSNRLPKRKRDTARRTLLEALEQRQLMAVGPQLTAIQPNEGGLLFDVRQLPAADSVAPGSRPILIEGYTQNVAPRELVFRFDGTTEIDPETLGAIQITRAGADGVFESATETTDFGTGGAAMVEFRSRTPGVSGNGQQIRLTSVNRSGTSLPIIRVVNDVIEIELNSNPARPTRVQDLLIALDGSEAGSRIEAVQVSGSTLTPIGPAITAPRTLTLRGANAAESITSLGTTDGTLVRLVATDSGPEGQGIRVEVTRRNFGGAANPVVTVQGRTIQVMLNSTPGFASTVNDFISAINSSPEASQLVTAVLQAGSGTTSLASLPSNFQPLVLTGAGDVVVSPGYVGLGDSPREVVFRFTENLPDDTYRIDILGSGSDALRNLAGDAFYNGVNLGIEFELNLGPQVVAVVPEPVRRLSNGQLATAAGTIEVHFNDDDLLPSAAKDRNFYQLVFQASDGSQIAVKPASVNYSALTNIATLNFGSPLSRLVDPTSPTGEFLTGAFRLKIGTSEALPGTPVRVPSAGDSGDSFAGAQDLSGYLGSLAGGTQSLIIDGQIRNSDLFPFQMPGGPGTPGSQALRPDDPSRLLGPAPFDYYRLDENGDLMGDPDDDAGITVVHYNFQPSFLGPDPTGGQKTYFNIITDQQKQRVREVMTLFSEYLGIQFVESENLGTTLVVGDLYGANGDAVGGQGGLVAALRPSDANGDSFPDLGVLDFQDFDEADDDSFGGEFSRGAMLLVGQLIGYGLADDLPQPVSQSSSFVLNPGADTEPTYPSVADILHGQFLYRPESMDIDLYEFTLDGPGRLSAETFAERAGDVSLLDTALRLYRRLPSGQFEEIASNDDYSSKDSLLEMNLQAGTYVLGVSASGNTEYDPTISGTGFGGRSEGDYQLRLTITPDQPQGLVDATGVALDGDGDGRPGGVFNFWYTPAEPLNPAQRALELQAGESVTPATIFVDKAATSAGNGSLQSPYREIDMAIAAARSGDVIRIVANGGADGRISTAEDNLSYQIGVSSLGQTLADGRSLEVPQGVTVVVDAGAVIKFRNSHVSVGSNSPTINRSGGALQVLGTPVIVEANGLIATNNLLEPIPGSVYFTSLSDSSVGAGNTPTNQTARPGDWGGIEFRGDLDASDESRANLEDQGIFLNQIYGADIRYGGGQVSVAGASQVISPIDIDVTRPTIAHSRITNSADSAIEATPRSFIETDFIDYVGPSEVGTISDYRRVGPDIHNNTIVGNSINGLFIRTRTRTGESLVPLTGQARFDDTDIVHVLTENLVIQGTPGGPIVESTVPPSLLISGTPTSGGSLAAGSYVYRVAYVDAAGSESPASDPTQPITTTSTGSIRLTQLPVVPQGSAFVARRLYRAPVDASGAIGEFRLAANLNGSSTSFTDNGAMNGALLVERPVQYRARLDASLRIDEGMVVKLDGARIETTFGGSLIAEGSDSRPIVMTSLSDTRYGGSGSFATDGRSTADTFSAGDWGGIYVGYASSASIDHARISGAGGVSRIEGGFAAFNAIEVHQGELRLTNSRLEDNATGRADNLADPNRAGRGENGEGTVFVRGAAPTIVNNEFIGNGGAAISINLNSMGFATTNDPGRSTGHIDRFDIRGNAGPLIRQNRLDDNDLNGMRVRGGEATTEIVFDDTDITHIVLDTITIPNQHVFGGMRLVSSPEASLVVKFESRDGEVAGIVVGGTLVSATNQLGATPDRIGGSLQLVGFPDYPVILTTLADDSAGGGFTPDGRPQLDTNNDGSLEGGIGTVDGFPQLPHGPEVNNGGRIDNDVDVNVPGFFQATPGPGGAITFALGGSGVTTEGANGITIDQDYIFEFLNYVDVGSDGTAVSLDTTTVTQQPTLIADDRVRTQGTFQGANGEITWTVDTYFLDGVPVLFNTLTLESSTTLGNLRVISYLDEDVEFPSDDILFTTGTPGQPDFRAHTIDGASRIGFSHGGYYEAGDNLQNATYAGWAADLYPILRGDLEGPGTQYTVAGNIDVAALPPQNDPILGTTYGPGDVTTAFAWDVNPTASTATITSFLELIPRDPSSPQSRVESGLWDGVTIREGASNRNVVGTPEAETTTQVAPGVNGVPGSAQFLGELAAESRGGDENQRLGFVVDGNIATRDDLDVYSFVGRAGSEVWFDIDRTDMSLDSVIELIDANGNVLASSDNSAAEALDPSLLYRSPNIDGDSVKSMNLLPLDEQTLTAAQDAYSTNPRDAGFRMTLPGEAGTRNLYHVRVRSSNNAAGDVTPTGPNSPLVRAGLTQGSYRMQVRLREADEFPGTQVRHGDVRYAETNLRIIGQPFHSPLLGDAQETSGDNDSRANAQPIGPYSLDANANNPAAANLAASDRLSLSVGGRIDSATDVDWYQFSIDYQNLPAGSAARYLSTVLDLDYADGFSRANMSLYVFNQAGQLVLSGLDSNIAEDQPRPGQGADSTDLSRGSAGTGDPFIGMAELPEGTYYVAVTNHSRVPAVLNQYYAPAGNPNVVDDPLLRLEPLSSVRRIAEDHIGGGAQTADQPGSPNGPQLLFSGDSVIPLTLNDLVMYTMTFTGSGVQSSLNMNNPFNGTNYGSVGTMDPHFQDFAVRPTGEFFGYNIGTNDGDWFYYQINSETGAVTQRGSSGIETFHEELDDEGNIVVVQSNVGMRVRALTYRDSDRGFFIADRQDANNGAGLGPDYTQNILYLFDAATGQALSEPLADRAPFTVGDVTIDPRGGGAGTDVVERGYIDTLFASGAPTSINVGPATTVAPDGTATWTLRDGVSFGVRDANGTLYRFEFNSGPDFRMRYDADNGVFVRDGDQITINGVPYEFDTGGAIQTSSGGNITDGSTITLAGADGATRTFELTRDGVVAAGNLPVAYTTSMSAGQVAAALAAAINGSDTGITADPLGTSGRIALSGDSANTSPTTTGAGVTYEGEHGLDSINAVAVRLEEGVSFEMFVDAMAAAVQSPVTVGVAGDRVNFRGAVSGNDFSDLVDRGIIIATGDGADGSYGNGTVSVGATGIDFLASDSAATIAARIAAAVNNAQTGAVSASSSGRTVSFSDAVLTRSEVESPGSPLRLANVAPGGTVTGIAMIGGSLYAVSDEGGLYVVNNPNAAATGRIGNYVGSATDLVGIDFSGLSQGPRINYVDTWTTPGTSVTRSMENLLFGSDSQGNIHAFDRFGVLQPIFAGGATSFATGRGGMTGVEMSTLDYNLWHVTERRGDDAGHGVNADPFGTRPAQRGGSSLYFGYAQGDEGRYQPGAAQGNAYDAANRPTTRPRLDGQPVEGTYNFPGGAQGAIESAEFSLEGYTSSDSPFLYFNYFLDNDGVDGRNNNGGGGNADPIDDDGDSDRDALQVYVITPSGEAVLVATNNSARGDGFSDDALDQVDGAAVRELFDNSGWRQARVPLSSFAGLKGLKLRIEFSTAGQMSNGMLQMRTIGGDALDDGETVTIDDTAFELDFGPVLTLPGGALIAQHYSQADGGTPGADPDTRVSLTVNGTTYVLSDGLRTIEPGEVEVLLAIEDDPSTPDVDESRSIEQLTGEQVADLLRTAMLANRPGPTEVSTSVNFSDEPNDEIPQATRLPRASGDTLLSGTGRIGTAAGGQLNDVDLSRIHLSAGERIEIDVTRSGGLLEPQIRLFNAQGRELVADSGTNSASVTYVATEDGPIYIGINGGSDYNPMIAGSGEARFGGTYDVTLRTQMPFNPLQVENRIQLIGATSAVTNSPSVLPLAGSAGVDEDAVRVPLRIDMTADQVASAMQQAMARRFSGGATSAYPTRGSVIELGDLDVSDAGPFAVLGELTGDRFGALGPGRAIDNAHEGVYLDDFVIGFAERGEMITGASANDTFAPTQEPNVTTPAQPTDPLVTGSYQLEIRDGSEYVNTAGSRYFRTFDTNDRMVAGATRLITPPANRIVDGTTFTISDGVRELTFEFDQVGSPDGVAPGNVRVPFDSTTNSLNSAGDVARAIVDAINAPSVQSLLDVSALTAAGVDGGNSSNMVDLFGAAIVNDPSGLLDVVTSTGRGDSNREQDDQGVILIENSRFSYAASYGIDINHSSTSTIAGQTTNNLVRYPRNLVELNTSGFVPGVVVQSNTIAFSGTGGIRVTGLEETGAQIDPVPFDRIVNNTIVGGSIDPRDTTPAQLYQGLLFADGAAAFADAVVSYTPLAGGGPQPGAEFRDPTQALGAPDVASAGPEPVTGDGTVSLGYGGSITLAFTDNLLTGDGTPAPDLVVFEVGDIESVAVEVSRDGITFISVGTVGGLSNRIDIDAFGFTRQDRLAFVRLTDLRQGNRNSLTTGADIDAVGALSSVPSDVYTAGGTGITISQNAAPTLLNNVIANHEVGITADTTSSGTVSGGNAFYRNDTEVAGAAQLGQFTQVLPDAANVFVSPINLVFDPASGSPIIDSAIDSLADRPQLVTVRGPLGLEPSPILAPRLDIHGQLRVDDPLVDSPSGLGENVFKDRGAADRADQAGPVGQVVLPVDNDAAGMDQDPATGTVNFIGGGVPAFEIQLVDGVAPNDPVPGVGIDDASVTSASVLVMRDNVPLVEGVDYRFAYQPTTNTIRLTPLTGVWQEDSVYTIRLLDRNDSVLVASDGDLYPDGAVLNIVDAEGALTTLEIETGISIRVPNRDGQPQFLDGTLFSIFDGVNLVQFEIDTDQATTPGRIPISLRPNMNLEDVVAAYVDAINGAGLNLTATASDGDRIQLTGSNVLSQVDPLDSQIVVTGQIGVSTGYGLRIPVGAPTVGGPGVPNISDGQTFAIRRGAAQIVRFEITTDGVVNNPGHIPVTIPSGASLDQIANALVQAIGGAGLGLSPTNAGFGRVTLGGDASYSIELTNTTLEVAGVPGQQPSVAVPLSIAPEMTAAEVAQVLAEAIEDQDPAGVTVSVVGSRVIINGAEGITGIGALSVVTIRDRVGNLMQSNQPDGTTQYTIFLGAGYDYGDAPDPEYPSRQASNGPRHEVTPGFSLGPTVSPDADAVPNDGDDDDGVRVTGPVYSGFDAPFQVFITDDIGGPFVLDYWVDWNRDGEFTENEKAGSLTSASLSVGGWNNIPVDAPRIGTPQDGLDVYSVAGETFARFRLSRTGVNSPLGDAPNGEVEDLAFTIQVNPFQNPAAATNPNARFDVNASGNVSPIDILQVINALNRAGTNSIELDPTNPPTSPPYLDVNGDGRVTPIDALQVVNYIEQVVLNNNPSGESARTYVAAGGGVMASAATFASPVSSSTTMAPPVAEGEAGEDEERETVSRRATSARATDSPGSTSVFDSAPVIALEEVLDALAAETSRGEAEDGSADSSDASRSLHDSVFEELGR